MLVNIPDTFLSLAHVLRGYIDESIDLNCHWDCKVKTSKALCLFPFSLSFFPCPPVSDSLKLSIGFDSWLGSRLIATARTTNRHKHTGSFYSLWRLELLIRAVFKLKNKEWALLMIKLQIDSRSCRSSPRSSVCDRRYLWDHHHAAATAAVTSFGEMIEQTTALLHKLKGQHVTHR